METLFFLGLIPVNPGLFDVDKFSYLRSLLDSTAIAGLTLSSVNYQQAVKVLRKRLGKKQVIISNHMDTLMNMDAISSDRHLRDLRQLYDKTKSHVCSLKLLGIEATSSPVLLAKLPLELRLIVSRKVPDSNLDMDALLATFEEEQILSVPDEAKKECIRLPLPCFLVPKFRMPTVPIVNNLIHLQATLP